MRSNNLLPVPPVPVRGVSAAGEPHVIALCGVNVAYGRRLVLEDVTLGLPRARVVSVIGPNGSGKSTLLKAIAGLVPLSGGSIHVHVPHTRRGRAMAYVPQHEAVQWEFPVRVEDVVMMGRYPRIGWFRRPGAADRAAVGAALERMGMLDRRGTRIAQLSGGQQQRVFLARALAQDAPVILLDEPLTGVDATSEAIILEVMQEQAACGRTIVMATHDLTHATECSDLIVCLNRRVVAAGPPSEVFTPDILRRTYGGPALLFGGHRD